MMAWAFTGPMPGKASSSSCVAVFRLMRALLLRAGDLFSSRLLERLARDSSFSRAPGLSLPEWTESVVTAPPEGPTFLLPGGMTLRDWASAVGLSLPEAREVEALEGRPAAGLLWRSVFEPTVTRGRISLKR